MSVSTSAPKSRAGFHQGWVADICNAVTPSYEKWVLPAESPVVDIELLKIGNPLGVAMKAGMKSERISRGHYRRTFKTAVVIRCFCNGVRFSHQDQFIHYVEQLSEYLETISCPLRILGTSVEVQADPDEYEQAGIATCLMTVDSVEFSQ